MAAAETVPSALIISQKLQPAHPPQFSPCKADSFVIIAVTQRPMKMFEILHCKLISGIIAHTGNGFIFPQATFRGFYASILNEIRWKLSELQRPKVVT